MSDSQELRVGPAAPASAVGPARPAAPAGGTAGAPESQHADTSPVAATTDGQLGSAYAQFVVDSETHDVVIRILDSATDRVLQELPSPAVRAMMQSMNSYAELLARRRAAAQGAAGA